MIELIPATSVPPEAWPDILHKNHTDWFWPLSKIARSRTAYFGKPPIKLEGNAEEFEHYYVFTGYYWKPCSADTPGAEAFSHPYPIPAAGQWWRGDPDFYASKSEGGWYRRSGYRWDDVDGYYEKPSTTIKKYPA